MLYALSGSHITRPHVVAERRSRYRRPSRPHPSPRESPVPTRQTAARSAEHDVRWQRIMQLSSRLSTSLSGEDKTTWLALEELIHGHWLDVAVENYNRGFDTG